MGYERGGRYGRDEDPARRPHDDERSQRGDYGRYDAQRRHGADRDAPLAERERRYGGRHDADRSRASGYDRDDRGFFDRAGDELRSWFGDEEAERRRRLDERYDERDSARQDRGSGGLGNVGSAAGAFGVDVYGGGFGLGGDLYDYGSGRQRGAAHHDASYRSWRDRQMEQFDRDYDEYRREHQSKFDAEFHGWRTNRQTQRSALQRVREHQEVVGSDGGHVGTVDKVRGDQIILTRQDQDAHGHHHSIPSAWFTSVDEKVTIGRTADDAHAHWRDAERNSAFGGRADAQPGRSSATANQAGQFGER